MRTPQFLLLAGLATAAIATGYFLWSQGQQDSATSLVQGGSELMPEETPEQANLEGATEAQAKVDPGSTGGVAQAQRSTISGPSWTVDVTVSTPAGIPIEPGLQAVVMPRDEIRRTNGRSKLDLIANSEEVDFPWAAAPVDLRGNAKLSIPKTIEDPVVVLDGRFLFVEAGVKVEEGQDRIVLEAQQGSCLIVNLTDAGDAEPSGDVRLVGFKMGGQRSFSSRTSPLPQREFRGLAGGLTWMVVPQLKEHYSAGKMGLELEPGTVREVTLALEKGAIVRGTVLDDAGQPLAGAEIERRDNMPWMGMMNRGNEIKSDENGQFSVGPIGSGPQTIVASLEGRVTADTGEMELLDGEVRENVAITLSLGEKLAGQVLWPDGTPVSKALVVADHRTSGGNGGPWNRNRRREVGRETTDKEGYFEITGLKEGKYTLRASKKKKGSLGSKVNFYGEIAAASAGNQGIRLRLVAPKVLLGKVVDDLGQPVTEFSIRGRSAKDGGPDEKQKFEDAEGKFAFERLGEGSWRVTAEAKGFEQDEAVSIDLPRSSGELLLVLQRRGSISGTVLDSAGAPVVAARVAAKEEGARGGWGGWNRGPSANTDEEGRFTIDNLAPGRFEVTAQAEGWADSAAEIAIVTAGSTLENVALMLRRGGRIEGIASSPEGVPASGARITWGNNPMGFGNRGETRTDSSGRFSFENVTPGEWQVSMTASMEELGERMQNSRGGTGFANMMSDLVTETVVVEESETVSVVIGGEPVKPVTLVGKVERSSEPVEGAQVYAVSEGSAVFQGMKASTTDQNGMYSLTVDRPGAYVVSATKGNIGVETLIDVPQQEELSHNLTIPGGGLIGFVTLPNGEPAAGIRMALSREDGLARIRWNGNSARTDVEGRFEFPGLEPGMYTVRANTRGWNGGGNASFGIEIESGLTVGKAGDTRQDFRLRKPGTIEGSVVGPDGQPIADVTLFFRDASGRQVSNLSNTETDSAGQFERKGLSPGVYTITAKNAEYASVESTPVSVEPGKASPVRMTLTPATTLVAILLDAENKNARLRVEVFDKEGREVGSMMTMASMQTMFRQGSSSTERRVGPLPPGEYRVRASAADGRSEETTVKIGGNEGEKEVRLTLTD